MHAGAGQLRPPAPIPTTTAPGPNRGLLRARPADPCSTVSRDAGYDTALIGKAHLFAQGDRRRAHVRAGDARLRHRSIGAGERFRAAPTRTTTTSSPPTGSARGLYARYRADYEDRIARRASGQGERAAGRRAHGQLGRPARRRADRRPKPVPGRLLEEPERRHRTEVLSEVAWVGNAHHDGAHGAAQVRG